MLDVTRACLRCAGGDCQAPREVREACEDGSAYVYLAAFGSGIVKAGVSQGSRVVKRWIEQGADVASRVLVGNGREVRRFERRIQRELGVLTSVKGTQKMNILVSDADVLRARELLLQFGEEVYRTFPEAHCFHEEPQLLLPYYRIPPLDNRPLLLRIQPGLEVSGEILAVKGPVMLIKEGELPFALNLNDLVGRKLETTRASQKETQAALDSFLLRQHSHC